MTGTTTGLHEEANIFSGDEYSLILSSLEYTKRGFENCTSYPSYEFKCQQIDSVDKLMAKIRKMRKAGK